MKATVSVIIPTYNRKEELIRCIHTVFDQSYKNTIEIIIIDDTETSQKKVLEKEFSSEQLLGKERKITYIHNSNKKGAPFARNLGIKKATGKYIAFLDDDDIWLPEKLEKQIRIMEKNPLVGLVICHSLDKRFGKERISKPPKTVSHEFILKSFNLSSTSSYLLRKEVVIKLGGFDTCLHSAQEYDLAIRVSKNYKVRCIPEVLMIQHATKGQISEDWNRKICGLIEIYHKHGKDFSSISCCTTLINHIKFLGMLGLYSIGYFIGNKIYTIIIPAKEIYET